ncbi:DUF3105 domain-containing protein [Baekduia sp. Peel2402]|uniref:DUF3105 domain-containing protein n=1 Tax=Baekduia sp. Peel2402 TaxID=3458296 RepID=UPI00403E4AF3
MASRKEEKERLRKEREERQKAEDSKVAGKRRLQLVGAGVLGIVAVGAVIGAIVASGGGDDNKSSAANGEDAYAKAAIPARKVTDFDEAVKASGCVYKHYTSEGRTHLNSDTAVNNKYKTNPPTSGDHRPTPAADGVYAPANTPDKENYVHTLEHGRIELQYAPTAPKLVKDQLNTLFNEKNKGAEGYHMVLFQNNTEMPYEVAATAWTQLIGCKTVNDKTWDALRAFRDRFTDKGPELIQ